METAAENAGISINETVYASYSFPQHQPKLNMSLNMSTLDNRSSIGTIAPVDTAPASVVTMILLTALFCIIEAIGILGNSLVIIVILLDRKMRQSVTNIFIMNLAIADLVIMLFGIPEIVQVMLNEGWLLGRTLCKTNRFLLVACLHSSILSLLSVCIERFVAIVFPLKAQIFCNRRKNVVIVSLIWPIALACALPTLIFNDLKQIVPNPRIVFCTILFPESSQGEVIYEYLQFSFFYLVPSIIQVILYVIIGRKLFKSTDDLHTKFQMRNENNCKSDRASETIKARKGVVKMLVASVIVYIVCYAPPQILLIYNSISDAPFESTWLLMVFGIVIAYINSAANPILYSIFSQNFRKNFKKCLLCVCLKHRRRKEYTRARFNSFDSRGFSRKVSGTTKTTISKV